jgi:hypothetical protein
MLGIIIIAFIIFLLLTPLPIKVSAIYDNRILAIKVYNHKVNLQSKREVKRNTKKALSMNINIKPIIDFLQKNKFKPSLKLNFKLAYGFGDAAYTGIFYGIIHAFYPFLLELTKSIMKIKKSELNIDPQFNKSIFSLEVNSIIFVSLVQLIYIAANILKIIKKNPIVD